MIYIQLMNNKFNTGRLFAQLRRRCFWCAL